MKDCVIALEDKAAVKLKESNRTSKSSDEIALFESFFNVLKTDDEKAFLDQYTSSKLLKNDNEVQVKLLAKAIETHKSADVVDTILNNVTDIRYTEDDGYNSYYVCVVAAACLAKDFQTLKKLLSHDKIEKPSMVKVIDSIIIKLDVNLFDQWFDDLYQFEKFDVNERFNENQTLLEKALWIANKTAIKKLCKEGAFIGFPVELYGEKGYLIDKMEPQVLQEIFDSCIAENDYYIKTKPYGITFDYRIFLRPKNHDANEMIPIMRILNCDELVHLLKHPIITSFVHLKWECISRWFYLNCMLYCFFGTSLIVFIIFKCEEFDSDSMFVSLPWFLTILGIAYLIIREALQLKRQPIKYLRMPANYLDIILIVLSIRIITMDFDPLYSKITIVLTVLLMSLELCVIVGHLPMLSISIHMLMLKEVLKTFFKIFTLYSIFVAMFALCFYVFFGKQEIKMKAAEFGNNTSDSKNCIDTEDKDKDDNKFKNIFEAIVKTMAMVVGELDFGSLNFQNAFGYILVLLFIICMTVVLMNLLNGLAVSDIQTIKDQAELNELISRAQLLESWFDKHIKKKDDCLCNYSLTVNPNAEDIPNKVTFPTTCELSMCSKGSTIQSSTKKNICGKIKDLMNGKCTAMAASIVSDAANVIISNRNRGARDPKFEYFAVRVQSIEDNVKKLLEKCMKNE